ncbi:pyridoxamine 5'-phosphate oxidase family protein [Bacillus tianshenii]|uniref:pyridoxamine 5'-phosphate oxidase family protein n=1 Tax=Sutcliffiella tianshenii TaxID=1463404 RepID=UPI001CD57C6E|nr:pyridoxamine 5'-phosphate oxidase family protein [Bacillus tianshenii]MCA1318635.1 pyridoxamine 5'-phosphate oxidase family protein [Bacillus tianshenii]
MNEGLENKITEMFSDHKVGTLATIRENRPYSRFMIFFHEGLTLYTATNQHTHKIEDIKANPHVHILLGMENTSWNEPYAEIEAEATVEENQELKNKFWDDKLSEWIKSPEDPEYLLLKLSPSAIRYYEKAGSEAEIWTD